jgi:hypothetical protein
MRIHNKYLSVYPWHSINLIPQFGCIVICEDEYPHKRDGSLLEIVLFGYVIHLHIPIELPGMSVRLRGPLWSKSKKIWYKAPK